MGCSGSKAVGCCRTRPPWLTSCLACTDAESDSDRFSLIPSPTPRSVPSIASVAPQMVAVDDSDLDENQDLELDENEYSEFELYKSFCPRVVLRRYEDRAEPPTDMEIDYFLAVSKCLYYLPVLRAASMSPYSSCDLLLNG